MRTLVWVLGVFVVTTSGSVHADPSLEELEARGEQLAKQNDYTQAIATFKQADALQPRAAHACMIGLAYMRRELWPQAELFLALCEKRAAPTDQPPAWIDEAEHQLAQKLSAARIPAVTITVTPANVDAKLTVSTFEPDEAFAPQTIHLAPGMHVVQVTAPGYLPQRRDVEVHPAQPTTLDFKLVPIAVATPPTPPTPPTPETPSHLGRYVPWIVGGVGVATLGIGLIYDLAVLGPARDRLASAPNAQIYDASKDDFSSKQHATEGILAGGVVALAVAVVLHYTLAERAPVVSASLGDHHGGLTVTWSR